uniref:Uncharacterized protein n=1 Tax=Equus asinus asinus TaxID=83772 RepID=A0A8C4MV33_EQUAS
MRILHLLLVLLFVFLLPVPGKLDIVHRLHCFIGGGVCFWFFCPPWTKVIYPCGIAGEKCCKINWK